MNILISRYLIYGVFFLTPTTLAMFAPITFNNKLTSGGIVLLLSILFLTYVAKIKYQKEHLYLLMFILINIIYYFISILHYGVWPIHKDMFDTTIVLITSLITMFTVFVYYAVIIKSKANLLLFPWLFGAGIFVNAIFAILMYNVVSKVFDISSTYEFRDIFYKLETDPKLDETMNTLPSIAQWVFKYYDIMGGTASIGPFLSFAATYLLIYFIFSSNKSKSIFLLFISFMAYYGAYLMASRSSLLTPVVGIITLFLILSYQQYKKYFIISLFVMIGLFFSIIWLIYFYSDSIPILKRLTLEVMLENQRIKLWSVALLLSLFNPFGYGYNYIWLNYAFLDGNFPFEMVFEFHHVHSVYFMTLLEFGFIGLSILLILFYALFRGGYDNIQYFKNTPYYPIAVSTMGAFIVSIFQFIFGALFVRSEAIYGGSFWLIVSMILVLSYYRRNKIEI